MSAIHRDDAGREAITHLLTWQFYSYDQLRKVGWFTREEVVRHMETGDSFRTLSWGGNGWRRGEEIHVVYHWTGIYLRTDANDIAADNQGKLPERELV